MDALNNILVIFDEKHDTQTAMLRAIELSRLTQARIHIIATVYSNLNVIDGELHIDTEQILREGLQSRLNKELRDYIDTLDAAGIDISYESLWSPHPHLDIASLCERETFDLLIKTANKHGRFEGIFHTPLDWHLLRECPCPVLLVSEDKWPEGSSILVAINANSDDKAHSHLNTMLIKTANYFGLLLNHTVYVVNACPPLPILIDLEYTAIDPGTYFNNMHKIARDNILDIIKSYDLDESNIKIIDGNPEEAIPRVAQEMKSRLIILGTVSRTGLKGFVMGNTAEHLLHNPSCDVLALKPEGFHYNP